MKRQTRRFLLRVLYIVFMILAVFLTVATLLNQYYSESWRLFYFDAISGFPENSVYRYVFLTLLIITVLTLLHSSVCRLFNLAWTLRIHIGKLCLKLRYPQKRRRRMLIQLTSFFLAILSCALCGQTLLAEWKNPPKHNLWLGDTLVGHAFGAIDGITYTNSREAFDLRYEQGIKTFEVDLALTSDQQVVLAHDYNRSNPPTLEEFLSGNAKGRSSTEDPMPPTQFTPMSFIDLCLIMKEHPEIWIITDSKYTDGANIRAEFTSMVNAAKSVDAEDVLDRLVIQIYNEDMYRILKDIYPFKSFIFTLYQRWGGGKMDEFEKICRWCLINQVDALCMWETLYYDSVVDIAGRYGLDVYVHTVNDLSVAKNAVSRGARGVYTDSITSLK